MSTDSPASILFDEFGHPIGVLFDGYVYRLQVEAKLTPDSIVSVKSFNNTQFLAADKSVFGSGVVANRISQISADFSGTLTDQFNNDIGQITSGGSTISIGNGLLIISSGIATTSSAKAFTNSTIKYTPGREIYAQSTAGFTIPTDHNSEQRIGIFDGYNGFFVGFHGTIFGITIRNIGVDTFIPRSSFDGDILDGNASSIFTRNNIPEAIDLTLENIYRIRFGWLGAAPIFFEVMSPDGQWVIFHTIRYPNTSFGPSIANPNVPFTFEIVKNNSDTTNIQIRTSSWDAGVVDSPSNPFKVVPTFSLFNSTTTSLTASSIFVGKSEDVSGFVSIDVTILADTISAVNGLIFEWSQDNIVFNYSESFTILANAGAFYSLAPRAKYFRVSYTNGLTDQGGFALTTVYYPVQRSEYVQNLDTDVPAQKAVNVVRSVMAAQKQGGIDNNYTNLQATSSGILKVALNTSIYPPINSITLIQAHNTGPVFAENISTTFISNVAINNTIIVVVIQNQGTFNNNYTLADTLSSVYYKAASTNIITPSGSSIDVWYSTVNVAGNCTIVANNFITNTHLAMQIYEVNGILEPSNPVDEIAVSTSIGTSLSVGPVTTDFVSEFCITAYGTDISTIISPGIGWSPDLSFAGFGCFSQIQNTNSPLIGTATTSVSVNSINLLVTFAPFIDTKPIQTDQNGRFIVRSEISDDINGPAAVKPPNTPAVASDPALVVAISPNSSIIIASADGYATTIAPSYANNTFNPLSLTTSGALRVDGSSVTQPISGTVEQLMLVVEYFLFNLLEQPIQQLLVFLLHYLMLLC